MAKKYQDLSDAQRAKFHAKLEALGIDPNTVPATVTTESGGLRCGHPAASADFPPAQVHEIGSVADLCAMGGCPDEDYQAKRASDAFVDYPPPAASLGMPSLASCGGDVCQLKDRMTVQHHEAVGKALHAAVMGDSSKVSDYEEHINAIHFPMQIATHAAQHLVITKDNPLIINDPNGQPTNLVVATITIEEGGYIEMKTPLNIECQQFTVE
ncbi:MAG: hypothetical protein F6J94_05660 [Moorea sp. SIO1F2]|uniref:hypothetical protein n=1 Tax=Moorena sp. SIO1F2 TaxID=2607819 RepID=UPI0013B9B112|nr:hypothetical protein [Moorena sp. SIO1F2]NET81455.1 hypothetical protein [Moorena sp. SIO1F2]